MDPKLSLHTPQTAGEEIKQHETAVSHTRIQTALLALALLAGGNGVAQAQQAPQTTGSGTESTPILQSGELPKPVTVTSGGKHTDIKPGKDGKYTITTSVDSSSPSASLQGTKGYGQIVDTPYGKLSFAEIQNHEKKDEILDDIMTTEQQREYANWKKGIKQAVIESNKGKLENQKAVIIEGENIDKGTQARTEANNEKKEQLIKKAEEYIILAEQGKLVPNKEFIKSNILDNPLFDKKLKERARKFI